MDLRWLQWAKSLQGIAQNGLTYATDPYDRERYEAIRSLAAEMMASYAEADPSYVRALFALDTGHITPKSDVRGVVLWEGRLLLVRERSDGLWTLPGGWADPGESPSAMVEREIYEESGYRTRAVRLLALYDRAKHTHDPEPYDVYKAYFLCELLDVGPHEDGSSRHVRPGRPAESLVGGTAYDEIAEVAFVDPESLPPLSTRRVTADQIARLVALATHPERPAEFD